MLFSTAGSRDEARKIARGLVERKLVACVNIVGPIESIYRWNQNVEQAEEFMLVMKTERRLFHDVERVVREIHSYDVPELIQLSIDGGMDAYLQWITDSVRPA